MIILILIWTIGEGLREAVSDHKNYNYVKIKHTVYSLTRAVFYVLVFLYAKVFILVFAIFIFPFLHDGIYYIFRNYLATQDGLAKCYPKGWFSQGKTAVTEAFFTPAVRIIFFCLGIASVIINFIVQ